ncbi:hypothetical protein BGZ70_007043 [Mortierella alpina]|uniref:GH16 domain-containing protein n=1 Tax=Mortierella alpina TaxID=64518 RepID=A0A9P6JEI6_MORAP|nr:hypothetical protein BGZ70_007043 [Mortierella alpina]
MKSFYPLTLLATLALSASNVASSAAVPESITIPYSQAFAARMDVDNDHPVSIAGRRPKAFFEPLLLPKKTVARIRDPASAVTSKFYIPDNTGPDRWSCRYQSQEVKITPEGAVLSIGRNDEKKPYSCSELVHIQEAHYGTYSVDMISSNVRGHVTGFFVIANGVSEIDMELTGLDSTYLWINVWKRNVQHPIKVPLDFDAAKDWHTYSFEWRKDYIAWYVDGKLIRKRKDISTKDPSDTTYRLALNSWTHDNVDDWAGRFSMPKNRTVESKFRNLRYTP